MTPDDSDSELRKQFARLRADERPGAGPFRVPVRAARQGVRRRGPLVPILLSLAALALIVIRMLAGRDALTGGGHQPPLSVIPVSSWETPTDFLLETPGRELLRGIPAIGELRGWNAGNPAAEQPDTERPLSERRTS